ncbi:hypothetical protein NQD34_007827 [Periophthalmus magnuspinnatus]|uniref:tRNA-splicing endonuclease subunit Sen2 n=1 Tax=Periophthalmus magnuspinnatus TaxID=409849 RepID=UPI00145A0625|nr:tRNA-splicing endonuclease subunit Sen2 [Periophthalmus magnuspinnatus]KAJ0002678.1 hypothetical protein NQD34_007827 [Periophthalmus magnuspinnatus]
MEAEFRGPKRRPRVYEVYEAPFPLNQNQDQDQNQFRADLINQQVLVQNQDHIRTIYKQGFFGKGILSKSGPANSVFDQWENHEGLMLPVVFSSRYEEMLQWAGHTLSAQGLDNAAVHHRLQQVSSGVTVEEVQVQIQSREDQTPESRPIPGPEPRPRADPGFSVPGCGFVLVRSDPEGDTEIRRVPISVTEFLQLSHEEAFFLVYALGVLTVYHNQAPLSLLQLWRTFCALSPDFVSSYAAYHFYRSRGWVPKTGSGAKYGTDMMLYRKGPPFYHASFSVVVQRKTADWEQRRRVDEEQRMGDPPLRLFSWRSLSALSRVTANVSKELLLCYIIFPIDQSEAEMGSPGCLQRLSVQEVMVSRWVSSKERSDQDEI